MTARIGLLLAALFLAGGALWVQFGGGDSAPVTQPPPVVTPGQGQNGGSNGGQTGGQPGGQNGGQTGGNPQQPPSLEQQVKTRAAEILPLMKAGDLGALAAYVHPTKGLRFSPYVYSTPTDRVVPAGQLGGAMGDQTAVLWGTFDGSGEPMNLTFQAYWNRFVWDRDFTASTQIAVDSRQGTGNSIDNTAATFPGAHWVEYHTPGSAQYNGMDWASLRLVFEQHNGQWYLVAIVRDQWTI